MTVTSALILEKDACYHARNFFSQVQKGTPGLTHKECILQRASLGAHCDVKVVLGMRSSILRRWNMTSQGDNPIIQETVLNNLISSVLQQLISFVLVIPCLEYIRSVLLSNKNETYFRLCKFVNKTK